ncbi:MCE family protein [Nocardia goodfellowii]|uniref:Virulence factor Mce-like protein n=1 Tax=Nocardia goodfellowii TaxID=882446 RepID=A0ABS4QAY0_9NOCA|nr:MCE family protein [Nocardia goodfellowii]MBP2188860.1 virulence factor Mce-like protein [Nocardia goodfellowii]
MAGNRRDPLTVLRSAGRSTKVLALLAVAVVALCATLWWLDSRLNTTRITAYFDRAVGIYAGSDVRVLGVAVGRIDSIEPMGAQVKVVMSVDRAYDIPADAKAAQVTPSVVADRYIQLMPVYRGGPKMPRNAVIPKERTVTPVEVDELYRSITELTEALGPNGADKEGAVNELVRTSAANLAGNGEALGRTITELSKAAKFLADDSGDIFDTVENLQVFVSMLAENDQQVRQFNAQLADLAGFLGDERQNLGAALHLLSIGLGDVARFLDENNALIGDNAVALTSLTRTLADQRDDLAAALPVLTLALSNLINVHNAESGTLDMRANFTDLQDPFGVICKMIDLSRLMPGDPEFEAVGRQMRPLIEHCREIADQITAGVQTPSLILPFGILSAENQQRAPVPGTVPGTPSNQLPPSRQPGGIR